MVDQLDLFGTLQKGDYNLVAIGNWQSCPVYNLVAIGDSWVCLVVQGCQSFL